MLTYLTTKKNESYEFQNIKLEWTDQNLSIKFLKEGWITESYVVITSFKEEENIDSFFLINETDNITVKERIRSYKLLNMSYKEYIAWITEKNIEIQYGSDSFDYKKLNGIEIRFKKLSKSIYPTVEGVKSSINLIKWKHLTL
jgi:hypothetical protein